MFSSRMLHSPVDDVDDDDGNDDEDDDDDDDNHHIHLSLPGLHHLLLLLPLLHLSAKMLFCPNCVHE